MHGEEVDIRLRTTTGRNISDDREPEGLGQAFKFKVLRAIQRFNVSRT